MNIAVVGSSGYIASFMIKKIMEKYSDAKIMKIDRCSKADYFLELEMPDDFDYSLLDDIEYVIFTAAVSGPDKCASEFEYCWNINVVGTKKFISEAIRRNCKVLFFSSDAVFGDIPGKVYTELSKTEARTPYGRMKKEIEDTFKMERQFKAIRLSYVLSSKDRFMSYCRECIANREKAEIFHPFYRNITTITDVINVVFWLIDHWEEFGFSILNVAGKELVSRIRIADEINRVCGGKLKYDIITPDGSFYKNRPAITQMQSLYIYSMNIVKDNTFSEKMLNEIKDSELFMEH